MRTEKEIRILLTKLEQLELQQGDKLPEKVKIQINALKWVLGEDF
jgi:hypothetical protein